MKIKRIAADAVLAAIALGIFVLEMQIPIPIPIPGLKLGLSNIITVFAMFFLGPIDALMILIVRILLGGIFSGNLISVLYSAAGGAMCYLSMLFMRRIVSKKQIWVSSVVGALFHNVGQICVAALITGTAAMFTYLPILEFFGVIAGVFTGICAQFAVSRAEKIKFLQK